MKQTTLILMILPLIIFSCSGGKIKETAKNENVKQDTIDSLQVFLDEKVKNWSELSKQGLTEFLKEFTYQEDKIEGGGWYLHKQRKSKYKTHIEVPVSSNGYFYLKTNYCGDDWIFHNQVVLNIDGNTLYSSKLESYSDYVVHTNNNGKVFESCHLTSPLEDNKIILAIASNAEKKISIRLKGDQNFEDITLSEDDKRIIGECYDLSQLLSVTNNEFVQQIILDDKRPKKASYLIPKGNFPTAEIKKTN